MQIGIDLIHIPRVTEAYKKLGSGFLARICTPVEAKRVTKHQRVGEKLAGIFALKEAFAKAVGTGIGAELSFQEIEVSESAFGKPMVRYLGKKLKCVKGLPLKIDASLSHENDYLIAVVLIENDLQEAKA